MENIPQLEVTPTSADEESNAAFALAMGELVEDQTETWIQLRYGPTTNTPESEDA